MSMRRLFTWALIITNIFAQLPGAAAVDRAAASTSPSQAFPQVWGAAPRRIQLNSGQLATPYPVLFPRASLAAAVVVKPVEPRLIAARIAAMNYVRFESKTHQAPLIIGRAAHIPLMRSQTNTLHRGVGTAQQSLSTRATQQVMRPLVVTTGTADPDGMNHWWTYQEDGLGGVGKYMVNVANGNLIAQSDDMAIPNKGIEFAFRRTYNSMSNHTYANTDGSTPSLNGDKWTNTFDAHIAYNNLTPVNGQQGVSLYDIDGARYDYTPVGDGHSYTPPAGQFAILYYDGTGYSWTKKSGTVYYFWDVNQPSNQAGLAGQIETIFGRNHNNYLSFTRSYTNGDASHATNLASIIVTAEDGRTSTLTFGDVSQNGSPNYRVLQSLTWPDGTTTVTYGYTIQFQGNTPIGPTLTQVTSPGNGSTTSGKLNEQYSYSSGTALVTNVFSPRYYCSHNSDCSSAQNPVMTGPAYTFSYGTGNTLSQVGYFGDVNPSVTDASGTGYLQPNATLDLGSTTPFRTASFTYSTGTTTWSDTDGHQAVYAFDSVGRVTGSTQTTGDPTGGTATLTGTEGWDSSNNLIYATDARGNESDFAYDNNGNAIEVAKPAAQTNVNGTIVSMRATSLYSFDGNNNVIAYCDPVWVHANGKDWTSRPPPSDSLCPSQSGVAIATWSIPGSYQPFGELSQITTPLGYSTTYSYGVAQQGGADYGLPTAVNGTSFTQQDGTNVTPQQTFTYDSHGNLICYSKGPGLWVLQYDSLNRVNAVGDPDDASLTNAGCSKTPGLPGSHIQSTTTYYPNGQVNSSQTPGEYAAGVSSTFGHDSDGSEISETKHFGGTAGTTTKIYDGADRLIEVAPPHDTTDFYSFGWLTRYLYDLTVGQGTVSYGTYNYVAHGNLYKTQEYVAPQTQWNAGQSGTPSWTDLQGAAFDSLDRQTTLFKYGGVAATKYDATSATLGLITTTTSQDNTVTTNTYDPLGRITAVSYAGTDATLSPSTQTTFDPDGRVASVYSAAFGTQTFMFDADGRLTKSAEPTGGAGLSNFPGSGTVNSSATFSYSYYPNGWKSAVSVSSSALSATNLLTLDYRADGLLSNEKLNYQSTQTFAFTDTSGGRNTGTTDPFSSTSKTYDQYGRLTTYNIPAGKYDTYKYDPEGNETSKHTSSTLNNQTTFTHTFNVRGELTDRTTSANGYPVPKPTSTPIPNPYPHDGTGFSFAPIMGVPTGSLSTPAPPTPAPIGGACTSFGPPPPLEQYVSASSTINYDAGGRRTGDSSSSQTTECISDTMRLVASASSHTSRGFDASDHQESEDTTGTGTGSYSASERIAWGPNGHPLMIGTNGPIYGGSPPPSYSVETLHWDGSQVLFTTNGNGQLDDIKVGTLADYLPLDSHHSGLTVWDRDPSGHIVSAHNSTGHDQWWVPDAYQQNQWLIPIEVASSGFVGQQSLAQCIQPGAGCNVGPTTNGMISDVVTDNITNVRTTIQGTRTYSPAEGVWTSPDAFGGVIDDPMSQKSYVYDRANPVTYGDPTGFMPNVRAAEGGRFSQGDLAGEVEDADSESRAKSAGQLTPTEAEVAADLATLVVVDDYVSTVAWASDGSSSGKRYMVPHAEGDLTSTVEYLASQDAYGSSGYLVIQTSDGGSYLFPASNHPKNPETDPYKPNGYGPAPNGEFAMGGLDKSYADGDYGSYGPVGFIPIQGTGDRTGVGLHSGHEDYTWGTLGCIRTTDAAMQLLETYRPTSILILSAPEP